VLRDEFVTVLARDHPAARRALTMESYLSLRHVLVSPEGQSFGLVDQALAQQGTQRTLGLTLANMFAVGPIVANTRMTATVLKRAALGSPAASRLKCYPPPVVLPDIVFHLLWHRRSDADPAQEWFRSVVAEVAATC